MADSRLYLYKNLTVVFEYLFDYILIVEVKASEGNLPV